MLDFQANRWVHPSAGAPSSSSQSPEEDEKGEDMLNQRLKTITASSAKHEDSSKGINFTNDSVSVSEEPSRKHIAEAQSNWIEYENAVRNQGDHSDVFRRGGAYLPLYWPNDQPRDFSVHMQPRIEWSNASLPLATSTQYRPSHAHPDSFASSSFLASQQRPIVSTQFNFCD